MATPNIERFDQIAAQAFAILYENFPVPRALTVNAFGVNRVADTWDDREILKEAEFVYACLKWLADAGYISHSGDQYPQYMDHAVLTAKGLEILKAIPDSISTEKSIGERLIDGVKNGATESLKEGVRFALAKGATFTLGAFGISS